MAQLTPLEQVQEDAKRITLQRIQEQKDSKAWQESQDRTVSLDEQPEVAVEKTVTTKKGK
jgi:antibiotic biosynthesis monooxygenase (ABM) superfamily enzyme